MSPGGWLNPQGRYDLFLPQFFTKIPRTFTRSFDAGGICDRISLTHESWGISYNYRVIWNYVGEEFVREYAAVPQWVAIAPGRINLIGEHTDYNGGFVFPAAIDRHVAIAVGINDEPETIILSKTFHRRFAFRHDDVSDLELRGWQSYPAGVVWAFKEAGYELPPLKVVIASDLPRGAGVSSSAAIELAYAVVWNEITQMGLDKKDLALLGQRAENGYVGVNCGIMDQLAVACGKAGHAMFIDTRSLEIEYAPIPSDLSLVLCETGVARSLASSKYNERRAECEEAAGILGVSQLRDSNLTDLEFARNSMSEVVFHRARHVISENARCLEFAQALAQRDDQRIGELMRTAHMSMKNDYEASCHELDVMAEIAWNQSGCIGARLTGAGFGGACIALVKSTEAEAFIQSVGETYYEKTKIEPRFLLCQAADGARILEQSS